MEKLGDRVYYVHAADNDSKDNRHLAVGDGTIDWEGLLLALIKTGYDGYVGLDIGNVPEIDDAMVRSRKILESLFTKLPVKGR